MNGDLLALVVGTVLAVGALAFVLYPLFFEAPPSPVASPAPPPDEESAIRALREIEFDRATGKLSDADYQALRASYAERAIREMRGTAAPAVPALPGVAAADDEVEARVRAYRQARRDCTRCGLRPEADAVYCSTCGDYLGGACPVCASPVTETSAAFCSTCGTPLGALAMAERPASVRV